MKRRHLWIIGVLGVLDLLLLATDPSCQRKPISTTTYTIYDGNVKVGYLSCGIETKTSLAWISVGIPYVKIPMFVTESKLLASSTVVTITNDAYKKDQGPGSKDELMGCWGSDFLVDPDDMNEALTQIVDRYYFQRHIGSLNEPLKTIFNRHLARASSKQGYLLSVKDEGQ